MNTSLPMGIMGNKTEVVIMEFFKGVLQNKVAVVLIVAVLAIAVGGLFV